MQADRALVIGGSIAGLCAAAVLSRHAGRVTVVDRDVYPDGVADRPGVPQGRHVHALLARGLRELDGLFPGFERRLRAAGAVEIDFGLDFAALRPFGWGPRVSLGLDLLFASRALIETTLRELCRQIPNVELVDRTMVTGLFTAAADGGGSRVTGVRTADGEKIDAALVVDASGRESRAPEWLRAIGVVSPAETVVDARAGYSTRWFAAPDPSRWPSEWWWKGIWIDPKLPDDTRAGVLFPVEGRRWIVTLGGLGGNYPPADEEGFTAELSRLRSPVLAQAVSLATPLSPVYGNRQMANRLRRYDRWDVRLPGFLAVADSVCAFNPVYGQGMTAAALCGRVLDECLTRFGIATSSELPSRFFDAQARAQRDLWEIATGADFLVPGTVGERPLASYLTVPYFEALFEAAMDDLTILRRFVEVINLVLPARTLFTPPMIARVVAGALRRRLSSSSTAEASMPPALGAASPQRDSA